jgi:AraC-like DNA-binding protein/quercetin dioxygenase-like cupin family protein
LEDHPEFSRAGLQPLPDHRFDDLEKGEAPDQRRLAAGPDAVLEAAGETHFLNPEVPVHEAQFFPKLRFALRLGQICEKSPELRQGIVQPVPFSGAVQSDECRDDVPDERGCRYCGQRLLSGLPHGPLFRDFHEIRLIPFGADRLVRKDKLLDNRAMRMEIPPASSYHGADFFVDPEIPLRVIHVESSPPFPLHSHDFHELVVICGGRGLHLYEGGSVELGRGDAFLIPRGMSHGYAASEDLDYVNVVYDAEALFGGVPPVGTRDSFDPSEGRSDGRPLGLSAFGFREILGLINRMDQEILLGRFGHRMMVRGLFWEIWCLLARECSDSDEEGPADPRSRVKRVMGYLEREGGPDVPVSDMASEAGMSVRNFHRVFRDVAGMPPSAYINGIRIERAKSLLLETDMTVTQIAGLVGYDDSNYFTELFKNTEGVSPGRFRKR